MNYVLYSEGCVDLSLDSQSNNKMDFKQFLIQNQEMAASTFPCFLVLRQRKDFSFQCGSPDVLASTLMKINSITIVCYIKKKFFRKKYEKNFY